MNWKIIASALQSDDRLTKVLTVALFLFALTLILSIAVAQTLAVVMIVGCTMLVIRQRRITYGPLDGFLLAFVFARALSILLSEHFEPSLRTLYAETPYLLLFFALNQLRTLSRQETVTLVVWALIAGGMVASLYGAFGFVLGLQERASSPGAGYYTMGTYLTAISTLSLVAARDRSLFPNRRWWAASVVVMLIGLILTLNRMHWLIIGVVVIIIGIIRERRLLAIFVASCVLALFLFPSVAGRLQQTLHFTANLSDRDILWRGAAMLFGDHPVLGHGPGSFHHIFRLRDLLADKKIGGWHNDYLQIYVESGLIGLAAFAAWMTAIFWKGIRCLLARRITESDRMRIKAVLAGIATILVSSLAASAALDIIILMLLSLLTAILSTYLRSVSEAQAI